MTQQPDDSARLSTGVRNLDELFHGGIPKGSIVVIAGPPGAGKTTLTQQICLHNASPTNRVLYFNTLSEPTAKTLRNLHQFSFFDAAKLDDGGIQFIDLGVILRAKGLEETAKTVMDYVKRVKPALVVIDSFRVFDDLARSREELRKFVYELAVNLMAWEATTFLLGEYASPDLGTNPLFSVIDGLIMVSQRLQSGEQQRFLQILKLRGTSHSRNEHSFVITAKGLEIFSPRVTLQREDRGSGLARCKTGISKLDELLGEGITRGSSLLVAGVSGTGKTILLLEFLYRGALAGEKGIFFSFEETEERLLATARSLGWDLAREIERGMVEIVFVAQPDIMIEQHLLMMQERVLSARPRRVALDSVSVFLHKVQDAFVDREKIFQLASIVQNSQAVGLFATDVPYGANQISRYGVEETIVDGIILLSSTEEGLERQRYLEVYKLRNTAHLKGRHNMVIATGGMTISPRYGVEAAMEPPPLETSRRLPSGVSRLDELCGGGLFERSVTLVSGSSGIGKSTLGLQFIVEGARRNEPGLFVAPEEGPSQVLRAAEGLGLSLKGATESGLVEIMYLSSEYIRASKFPTILYDKILAQRTRRLVLDGVNHMTRTVSDPEELRQLLYAMIVRFKASDVTSLFTLESDSMYSTNSVAERGYTPVADNIVMLRYLRAGGKTQPTVSVVKTRGSNHDWGSYCFKVARGGIQIGEALPEGNAAAPGRSRRG